MLDIYELSHADCPLLGNDSAAVLDRFNEAVRLFREVEQKYPALLEREEVKKRAGKLAEVRFGLSRERYLVGFLGTTQAGKSTAFNNILDASEREAPSQSGVGGATTSAITRVRRKRSVGDHALTLRYLTVEEYKVKRNKLCEAVKHTTVWSDEEILAGLPKYREAVRSGKATGAANAAGSVQDEGEILPEDLNALEHFLTSYQRYKDHVRETAYERIVPYAERARHLNHATVSGAKVQPSPNFLLKDAVIEFRTDRIPPQLEIIDLPGLGSQSSIDTLLTKGFLRQLDGALVFINANQINDEDVERVLARFKQYYDDRLTSRVWVVLTKVDSLRRQHFLGNESGTTLFDILTRFLEGHGIPPEQVCLTSDKIYQARGPDSLVKHEVAVGKLEGITLTDSVPPKFRGHSQLSKAFEELLKDGGVGRLRQLVADVLAREVARETRHQAEKVLAALVEELRDDLDMEARRKAASQDEILEAFKCCDRLTQLIGQWEARAGSLESLGQHLKIELEGQLEKVIPGDDAVLSKMPAAQLGQRLEILAGRLQETLHNLLDLGGVIEKVYGEIGSQLADLPAVRIWSDDGPQQAWERFCREDRRSHDWRGSFPSFSCKLLFTELPDVRPRREYRSLMREKVRTASHQAMHALKVRVRVRLQKLLEELSKLAYHDNVT